MINLKIMYEKIKAIRPCSKSYIEIMTFKYTYKSYKGQKKESIIIISTDNYEYVPALVGAE